MEIKRAFRFRLYPTQDQQLALAKTFGCARFVYNHMLQVRSEAWQERQESVGYSATSKLLTALKKDPRYCWLNEVSCVPVQQSLRHLQVAYTNFFQKRAGYPTFKSKYDAQAIEYTRSAFVWTGKLLKLAKMKEPLNIRFSRTIPKAARVSSLTVSRDTAGRYFVSMLTEDIVADLPLIAGAIGIDLGLTTFATLSTGEKVDPANLFRKSEKKLAKLQRRLAKKKTRVTEQKQSPH